MTRRIIWKNFGELRAGDEIIYINHLNKIMVDSIRKIYSHTRVIKLTISEERLEVGEGFAVIYYPGTVTKRNEPKEF